MYEFKLKNAAFLCVLVGIMFIVGPITVWSRNAGIGGMIVFCVIIGWKGLEGLHPNSTIESSGGIIGYLMAAGLQRSVGMLIGKIVLALSFVIGLYIAFDVPLANIIARLRDTCSAGAEVARERLVAPMAERVKSNGNGAKNSNKLAGKPAVKISDETEAEDAPKRRLLPILIRKGEQAEESAPVNPEQRISRSAWAMCRSPARLILWRSRKASPESIAYRRLRFWPILLHRLSGLRPSLKKTSR
jgi:hypothetical protein